jgi:hypothetical protein
MERNAKAMPESMLKVVMALFGYLLTDIAANAVFRIIIVRV